MFRPKHTLVENYSEKKNAIEKDLIGSKLVVGLKAPREAIRWGKVVHIENLKRKVEEKGGSFYINDRGEKREIEVFRVYYNNEDYFYQYKV